MPSIEELLVKVHNSKLFSCLDLKGGYHQVSLDPETKEKTAFCVNDRLYEYTRLPFGLRNAPSHFSRLMTSILSNLIGTAVLIYLDDIVVLGETVADHTHNLIRILEALKRSNLKINLAKCQFFKTSVEFLGHQVTPDSIRPVHDKVEAIRNYRRPRNPKEVSSFLGLASYYRKFIRNFALISRPLDALRRASKFQWTEEAEQPFVTLQSSSDDLLSYPKFDRPFLVTCDASSTALGGVISQLDDEQKERPVSFCSRALKGAETRYSAIEREALAIKFTLERHRYILIGHPIVIQNDHQLLKYLFKHSDLGARQSRWLNSLMEFDIRDFQYTKSKSNVIADALSRSVDSVESVHVLTRTQASRAKVRDQNMSTVIDPRGHLSDPRGQDMSTVFDPRGHLSDRRGQDMSTVFDPRGHLSVPRGQDVSTVVDPRGHLSDPRGQDISTVIAPGGHLSDPRGQDSSTVIDPRGHLSDPGGQHLSTVIDPRGQDVSKRCTCIDSTHPGLSSSNLSKCQMCTNTTDQSADACPTGLGLGMNVEYSGSRENISWDASQLIRDQDLDPLLSRVKAWVKNNQLDFPAELRMPKERFFIEDNVLYLHTPGEKRIGKSIMRTVLPPSFVNMAFQLVHASPVAGHLGTARTIQRAKTNFYWLNLDRDVKEYVKGCVLCQKFKGHKVKVPPARQWPICKDKFQRIHMDLVGPLPASLCGQKLICVMTDSLTRYVFTQALPDKSALSVANAFREFINLFGCPRQLRRHLARHKQVSKKVLG